VTGKTAIVVTTTTSTPKEAEDLADLLLQRRLAACVQLTPIRSKYLWKGKVAFHEETMLTIKTLQSAYPKLQSAIMEAHSYDVPEIVGQPVTGISRAYFDWIVSQVDAGP
jgi:periplasmic divalent cation tolerance protein